MSKNMSGLETLNLENIYLFDGINKENWDYFCKDINNESYCKKIMFTIYEYLTTQPNNGLTLDIIDYIIDYGCPRILNLCAQKNFLEQIIKLLKPEKNAGIENQKKVIFLVQRWAKKFKNDKNMEIFIQEYNLLKDNGITFPGDDFTLDTYNKYTGERKPNNTNNSNNMNNENKAVKINNFVNDNKNDKNLNSNINNNLNAPNSNINNNLNNNNNFNNTQNKNTQEFNSFNPSNIEKANQNNNNNFNNNSNQTLENKNSFNDNNNNNISPNINNQNNQIKNDINANNNQAFNSFNENNKIPYPNNINDNLNPNEPVSHSYVNPNSFQNNININNELNNNINNTNYIKSNSENLFPKDISLNMNKSKSTEFNSFGGSGTLRNKDNINHYQSGNFNNGNSGNYMLGNNMGYQSSNDIYGSAGLYNNNDYNRSNSNNIQEEGYSFSSK